LVRTIHNNLITTSYTISYKSNTMSDLVCTWCCKALLPQNQIKKALSILC